VCHFWSRFRSDRLPIIRPSCATIYREQRTSIFFISRGTRRRLVPGRQGATGARCDRRAAVGHGAPGDRRARATRAAVQFFGHRGLSLDRAVIALGSISAYNDWGMSPPCPAKVPKLWSLRSNWAPSLRAEAKAIRKKIIKETIPEDVTRAKAGAWLTLFSPWSKLQDARVMQSGTSGGYSDFRRNLKKPPFSLRGLAGFG